MRAIKRKQGLFEIWMFKRKKGTKKNEEENSEQNKNVQQEKPDNSSNNIKHTNKTLPKSSKTNSTVYIL